MISYSLHSNEKTWFIFLNNSVREKKSESFLLLEPSSREKCCTQKLQGFFQKNIYLGTVYTL